MQTDTSPPPPSTTSDRATVLAIVVASAALMLWTGTRLVPGFDEFWHIWYGESDGWSLFLEEVRFDSHPPVTYVLLRFLTSAGASVWFARSLTIATGLLSIPLFFWIARRLHVPRTYASVGTAAFACSHAFVQISICVRSYSVTVLAMLLAFHRVVRMWQSPADTRRRDIVVLAVAVVLAPWTTYSGALPLFGLAGAMLLLMCVHRGRARELCRSFGRHRPWPEALLVIAGAAGVLVWFKWAKRASVHHWTGEYLPQPDEGALSFLIRGTNLDISHFTPLSLADASPIGPLALALLTLAGCHQLFARLRDGTGSLPVFVVLGTLSLLFVAGLERHHPFGGKLRHQYVLFPFLQLAILVSFASLPRSLSTRLGTGLASGALAVAYGVWAVNGHLGPPVDESARTLPYEGQYRDLAGELEAGEGLFLGTFSFVGFYANARDDGGWKWRGPPQLIDDTLFDVFDGTIAGRAAVILRDRGHKSPTLTLTDRHPAVLHALIDRHELPALWFVEQSRDGRPPPGAGPIPAPLVQAFARHGLRIARELGTTRIRAWRIVRI